MKLSKFDRIEEKYDSSDVVVAPGGWCCNCWCCCSISYADYPDDGTGDPGEVGAY